MGQTNSLRNGVPRICVVGAGEWAARMHRPALARLVAAGRLAVAGVCDLNANAAGDFAAATSAGDTFADAGQMLDRCRPNGLIVLTPPQVTPAMILLAAERGIPFFTEKPPATDADTHRRLIDIVGELPHVIGYNRRFAPYCRQAREWLAGQCVQAVACRFTRHRRHDDDFTTTAVHAIDAVRFFAGELNDLRIDVVRVRDVFNFFIVASAAFGARVDIAIMPDTAAAQEHYSIFSAGRSVHVTFPQPKVIDLPGGVELHEGNKVTARLGAADFRLAGDDQPGLLGIVAEHEAFLDILTGTSCEATLSATLGTQLIRDELRREMD
jgi:myo-inositol 2-dehydrogenase/D-chiro-inositol 1-dehydrogenase